MKLILLFSLAMTVVVTPKALAGCLAPERSIGRDTLEVKNCSFRTTTDLLSDDPRVEASNTKQSPSDKSPLKPSDLLGKKSGDQQIYLLPSNRKGVVVQGTFKNNVVDVFLATSKTNFCDRFAKNRKIEVEIVEKCCDCSSCAEPPCSLGIKSEATEVRDR